MEQENDLQHDGPEFRRALAIGNVGLVSSIPILNTQERQAGSEQEKTHERESLHK